jgi:hypothetical protein
MVGTAVELEGVTINVLVLNQKKLSSATASKVKGESLTTTGETGLLNSLSGKLLTSILFLVLVIQVQVPMYKLEDKTPLRKYSTLVCS